MKILLSITLLVTAFTAFSDVKDTTFKIDLNFDRNEESVSCTFNEDTMEFTLRINNNRVSAVFDYAYDYAVEIIDISRNDNLKEVLVKGFGPSDQCDMYFYQYTADGNIINCGRLPSNFGVAATGNGTLTEYGWMGFWGIELKYDFDTRKKTLTLIDEEFYEVNQDCKVTNSFRLLAERDDNSVNAAVLMPGIKLTIVKADITPVCNYEDGSRDDFSCDWYFITASNGKKGWCRLKDFQNNVEGLIWAG